MILQRVILNLQQDNYIISKGNISAKRDWGYAPEYVDAMHRMLQSDKPDDYVIATDETHTVEEFLKYAFEYIGMDSHEYLEIDKRFVRPLDVPALRGDYSKARKELKWEPKTKFPELVKLMMKAELERWDMYLKGEQFPWDVPNYPNENNLLKTYRGNVK